MLAIYCRISREKEEGKDRSIEDQRLLGIDLAEELGLEYKVYIDEGVSGTSDISKRPQFSNMLDAIADGTITVVYAYDQSRLERKPEVRFVLKKLLKDNGTKLYDDSGEINLDDESTEFFGDIMSIINQYYVKITRRKIKSVLKRNVSLGKAHSSILPYGYRKDDNGYLVIETDNEEAVVKRIFNLSLSGIGTRTIANTLNDEKIPTRYNKIGKGTISTKNKYSGVITETEKKDIRWAPNTVLGIIKNTIYKGERNFSGNIYEAPVIIEPDVWEKVNKNLAKNKNNSGKKVDHSYLLKGYLTCARCGRNYYGRTRVDKKDNYYMCSSKRYKHEKCTNRGINIDAFEKFIWERFFTTSFLLDKLNEFLEDKKANDTETNVLKESSKVIADELRIVKKEKELAISLVFDGTLTKSDLAGRIKSINERVFDLETKLKNLTDQINFIIDGAIKHKKNLETNLEKIWKDSIKLDKKKSIAHEKHLKMWILKNKTPFNDKIELINKYIDRIFIDFQNDVYIIEINFKIPIDKQIFLIDKKYTYGLNLFTNKSYVINKDKDHLMLAKLKMLTEVSLQMSKLDK